MLWLLENLEPVSARARRAQVRGISAPRCREEGMPILRFGRRLLDAGMMLESAHAAL